MKVYVLGKILKSDSKAVAVVGSRMMTSRGKRLTQEFTKALIKKGFTIISGLARGVDTEAHRTALKEGGRTIAILGSGINIIYPPENKELSQEVIKHGAIISPFSPNTPPYAKNFLQRNKIVAGLSKAVLVIEGRRRSGTLSTASWAANSGIDVYAIPGSEATDYLIENGATSVTSPEELLDMLMYNGL